MDDFPKIDTEKNPRAVMYIHFAMDSETSNKCECNHGHVYHMTHGQGT